MYNSININNTQCVIALSLQTHSPRFILVQQASLGENPLMLPSIVQNQVLWLESGPYIVKVCTSVGYQGICMKTRLHFLYSH